MNAQDRIRSGLDVPLFSEIHLLLPLPKSFSINLDN